MIVKPTVNELLEHAENRFALVVATSRRARQIADEENKSNSGGISPVTIAANEINEGKVKICETLEEPEEVVNEEKIEEEKSENE